MTMVMSMVVFASLAAGSAALAAGGHVDSDAVLAQATEEHERLAKTMAEYSRTRIKGIKFQARKVLALSRFLDLGAGDAAARETARRYIAETAQAFAAACVPRGRVSYAENRTMRGWPIVIENEPEFDSYQFGYLAGAVAAGARHAYASGDVANASLLVAAVVGAFEDGFLTSDPERTKVDEGVIVFVPRRASTGRRRRYAEVHGSDEGGCLAGPQALNHGLSAATGAIHLLRALAAAPDADEALVERLRGFVLGVARFFAGSLHERRTKAADPYPKPGTTYYMWKYHDLSACAARKATEKDRWEDISHAGVEANFVYELRALLPREADAVGVTSGVVHGMLVTFLTRFVLDAKRDRDRHDGGRFACSMDRSDPHYFEKHCSSTSTRVSRASRAEGAVEWLPLAVAVHGGDEDLGCDAARVVAEVLAEFEAAAPHGVQTTVLTDILLARASFPDAYADAYRCDRRAGRSGNKTAR